MSIFQIHGQWQSVIGLSIRSISRGGICPSRLHGSGIIYGDAKIFKDRSFPVKLGDKRVVTMLWFVGVKERASFLFPFFFFFFVSSGRIKGLEEITTINHDKNMIWIRVGG